MIKARPTVWANRLFWTYLRRLLRRHFFAIWLVGQVPELNDHQPVLLLPNHHTWWDGFFAYLLNRSLFRRPFYLMMLEQQLRKNRFFTRVGAYSIDPLSPGGIRRSLDYTLSLLNGNPLIALFPQGELTASVEKNIRYRPGVDLLSRRSPQPLQWVQLAVKPLFLEQQRPELFILCGEPQITDAGAPLDLLNLQKSHEQLLDRLDKAILGNEPRQLLLQGQMSINNRQIPFWKSRQAR
ncbi:MAG TPA: lysophospholipid acyltransferase family protein [bacterium]|nr:lysophospholipid acyltransferase family protein [bacterium]HPG44370.1 lysophospholipid acyltransferase family protein [bacterium]HPM96928.1 lysophospholipid acyltransferase family protein [bacterium]